MAISIKVSSVVQNVVRVVRISKGNGTIRNAAAEKPVNRFKHEFGMGDYVRDATQYLK